MIINSNEKGVETLCTAYLRKKFEKLNEKLSVRKCKKQYPKI